MTATAHGCCTVCHTTGGNEHVTFAGKSCVVCNTTLRNIHISSINFENGVIGNTTGRDVYRAITNCCAVRCSAGTDVHTAAIYGCVVSHTTKGDAYEAIRFNRCTVCDTVNKHAAGSIHGCIICLAVETDVHVSIRINCCAVCCATIDFQTAPGIESCIVYNSVIVNEYISSSIDSCVVCHAVVGNCHMSIQYCITCHTIIVNIYSAIGINCCIVCHPVGANVYISSSIDSCIVRNSAGGDKHIHLGTNDCTGNSFTADNNVFCNFCICNGQGKIAIDLIQRVADTIINKVRTVDRDGAINGIFRSDRNCYVGKTGCPLCQFVSSGSLIFRNSNCKNRIRSNQGEIIDQITIFNRPACNSKVDNTVKSINSGTAFNLQCSAMDCTGRNKYQTAGTDRCIARSTGVKIHSSSRINRCIIRNTAGRDNNDSLSIDSCTIRNTTGKNVCPRTGINRGIICNTAGRNVHSTVGVNNRTSHLIVRRNQIVRCVNKNSRLGNNRQSQIAIDLIQRIGCSIVNKIISVDRDRTKLCISGSDPYRAGKISCPLCQFIRAGSLFFGNGNGIIRSSLNQRKIIDQIAIFFCPACNRKINSPVIGSGKYRSGFNLQCSLMDCITAENHRTIGINCGIFCNPTGIDLHYPRSINNSTVCNRVGMYRHRCPTQGQSADGIGNKTYISPLHQNFASLHISAVFLDF